MALWTDVGPDGTRVQQIPMNPMNFSHLQNRAKGFTLIELLVAVAILGIISAIAIPSYVDYVRRGYITEATAAMSTTRAGLEQFFLDNQTYVAAPCGASTTHFTLSCQVTATTYTITASGIGSVANFTYTLNQNDARSTTSPWGNGACWITRKWDTC